MATSYRFGVLLKLKVDKWFPYFHFNMIRTCFAINFKKLLHLIQTILYVNISNITLFLASFHKVEMCPYSYI